MKSNEFEQIKEKYPKMRTEPEFLEKTHKAIGKFQQTSRGATYRTVTEFLEEKPSSIKTAIGYLLRERKVAKKSQKTTPYSQIESSKGSRRMTFDWKEAEKTLEKMLSYAETNGLLSRSELREIRSIPSKRSQMEKIYPLIQEEWKKGRAKDVETVRTCTMPTKFIVK